MKLSASAISVIVLASSASAFAPMQQRSQAHSTVMVQASALDRLGLGNLEAEVSDTTTILLVCVAFMVTVPVANVFLVRSSSAQLQSWSSGLQLCEKIRTSRGNPSEDRRRGLC
jgi:hypothetical protein